jgi:hypothetical protein
MIEEKNLSGVATFQQGVAKSDGRLTISIDSVSFAPFNEQTNLGVVEFAISEIANVARSKGTGAGILPISSDAIKVTLDNGKEYEFIVSEPQQWIDALS